MALTRKELTKLLTALKREFGDNIDQVIDGISKGNISWINDDPSITFYDNNSKSVFNANYLTIISDNKKIPTCISSIKISKDKKNVIFCDIYGDKKILPYNKDIFIGMNKVPLDEFLNQIWYNIC